MVLAADPYELPAVRKEVNQMDWTTPDFEEYDTSAEVTAYAGRWERPD